MKIVVIQPLLPKYVISFLNHLVKSRPDIEWVALADIESKSSLNQYDAELSEFKVVHLRQVDAKGFAFRPGILRALCALEPDVVIFNANPRDVSQLLMMLWFRVFGRRFYAWGMFHRIGGLRLISKAYYKVAAWLSSGVWTYSRVGAKTLVDLGVPKGKIRIIGTAIDESIPLMHRTKVLPLDLLQLRERHGLGDRKIVLQVVRLSRIKKPQLLVAAAEIILGNRSDVVFVLIGSGEMRSELESLVIAKGIQESFRFLGPIYDEPVLAKWYLASSVFVVPTCIGLSAHHAMCYGLPVVTDNSLDEQASEFDILSDGLNSLLYDEGDVNSLARVITKIIDDDELRDFLGANAEKTIRYTHNMSNKVNRLCAALDGF